MSSLIFNNVVVDVGTFTEDELAFKDESGKIYQKIIMPGASLIDSEPPSKSANGWMYIDGNFIEIQPEESLIKNDEYKSKRAKAYPPMTDYLDGIVKGDQAQVQAYIDACLAVKAKYPKPQ